MVKISAHIQHIEKQFPRVREIADAIRTCGGRVVLVGGAVRDLFLALPVKDLDCEVYGLPLDDLEKTLRTFGAVSLVGKSFGVLRLYGLDVDWSLPRADSAGRKPTVRVDPHMPFADAFRRRDLTINAMGIDLHSGELIDPHNGQKDLKNNVLRSPDLETFVEDPLRFYRVMQFVGRFGMSVYPDGQLDTAMAAWLAVSDEVNVQRLSIYARESGFENAADKMDVFLTPSEFGQDRPEDQTLEAATAAQSVMKVLFDLAANGREDEIPPEFVQMWTDATARIDGQVNMEEIMQTIETIRGARNEPVRLRQRAGQNSGIVDSGIDNLGPP